MKQKVKKLKKVILYGRFTFTFTFFAFRWAWASEIIFENRYK